MTEQKPMQLGKRLGEKSTEASEEEVAAAKAKLAWSRSQEVPAEEDHRVVVEKG